MRLSGKYKTALVTGTSFGIEESFSRKFAKKGVCSSDGKNRGVTEEVTCVIVNAVKKERSPSSQRE